MLPSLWNEFVPEPWIANYNLFLLGSEWIPRVVFTPDLCKTLAFREFTLLDIYYLLVCANLSFTRRQLTVGVNWWVFLKTSRKLLAESSEASGVGRLPFPQDSRSSLLNVQHSQLNQKIQELPPPASSSSQIEPHRRHKHCTGD